MFYLTPLLVLSSQCMPLISYLEDHGYLIAKYCMMGTGTHMPSQKDGKKIILNPMSLAKVRKA